MAPGERADVDRQHCDDGRRGAGSAGCVFDAPSTLRGANWIFQVTPIRGSCGLYAGQPVRALFVLAVIPVLAASAAVFFAMWPWRAAAGHLAVLGLLGTLFAEICLHNFHKIPLTCSYLPGRSYMHMAVLSFLGLITLIVKGAEVERRALENSVGLAVMLGGFVILAALARWRTTAMAKSPEGALLFEEAPVPAVLGLGLNRDGVRPV